MRQLVVSMVSLYGLGIDCTTAGQASSSMTVMTNNFLLYIGWCLKLVVGWARLTQLAVFVSSDYLGVVSPFLFSSHCANWTRLFHCNDALKHPIDLAPVNCI